LLCKLSKEKQSIAVISPFMLYMPHSTQTCAGNDKQGPSKTRLSEINLLKRESSREQHFISLQISLPIRSSKVHQLKPFRLSEVVSLKRFLCREQFQNSLLSSLPARLREIQHLQGIWSMWHDFNGQSGIFRQFA
jgi:hypothetical protein